MIRPDTRPATGRRARGKPGSSIEDGFALRTFLAVLLWLATGVAGAAVAADSAATAVFPSLSTRNLDGAAVRVPDAFQRGPTLLVIGFTRDSGEQTRAWARRAAGESGVAVWNVAVIEDVPGLLRGMVVRGLRKGVPAELHARFLLVDDDSAQWKALAGFLPQREDAAHLVLLDAARRIAWRHAGPVDEPGWQALRAALRSASAAGPGG